MRIQNGIVTGTVSTSSITGSRVLAAGQWAHLVLVFDGALGTENTKLYIDGSPDTFSQVALTAIPLKNTAPLWIGALNDASPNGFIGAIDEVRVYQGKALTQAEIVDLYQGAPSNMGPQVSVTAPVSPVAQADCPIGGTVTDDGLPAVTTLAWSQVSGPGPAVFADSSSASTTVNFPVAGTYVLRLTANDGAIASYAELTSTVATSVTSFASWASGITDPTKRGPSDDADGDSIVNLLEFALGLDPNVSTSAGLPSAAINGTKFLSSLSGVQAQNSPTPSKSPRLSPEVAGQRSPQTPAVSGGT